ncbi:zinc phosphodiesterase ELAC protein 2 [Pholidichthys leucotaenia]
MNTVHVRLSCLASLLIKVSAPHHHNQHRTVLQCFRTMAANNQNYNKHNQTNFSPPVQRKAKQKETLRRVKIKEQRYNQGDIHEPSMVFLQVVGAGSRDGAASVYMFSDCNRYLFNCGEGTQRLMQEHKMKATRLDNIFLTRLSWETVGGLSGMLLTLKDMGVPECVLSGPPQLENYLSAIKSFSGSLEEIKLSVWPYTEETYSDETMAVYQVPIFAKLRDDGGKSSPSSGRNSPSKTPPMGGDFQFNTTDNPGGRGAREPSLVIAFMCKLHPKKGSFLVAQAKELGLPVGTAAIGPIVAALKSGKSIVHAGKEIRPEQVCTPTDPGPVFLIVECPSEEFVDALCTNKQLQRCQTGGEEDPAALVVHITPESVLKTDEYKKWMERFPSTTEHLILNEQVGTKHNIRSYKIQAQLSMIHPQIFPELKAFKTKEPQAALHVPNVRAECLLKFQFRPVMEWQRDAILSCNSEEFVKEASEVPDFLEEVDKCRKLSSTNAAQHTDGAEKYPEVVFLGTGSAVPMKIRNVSSTLVNISPGQSLLLDCGEGTFGQLCRHYGDDVDKVLSKISTVFISHLHADHHTGLIKLLYQRERALRTLGKPFSLIYLVAPVQIMIWLSQYHIYCEEILSHFNLIPSTFLCDGPDAPQSNTESLIQALLSKNNLKEFKTCVVRHCKNAFACSFTHQSGWKLAFSGDTMPCDAFVHIGKDATLLIHEATLEDGLEEEAVEKKHSTTSQAIGVGMKMKANFIMLNHFSQRYAKIPLFSEDFNDTVGISFDHMSIGFGDFKTIPRLIPALKTLFAEALDEMEERRERRELKYLWSSSREGVSRQETAWVSELAQGAKREQQDMELHNVETKRLKTC